MDRERILELAVSAENECSKIEFKSRFDASKPGDWCELIKDLVAMANSGGGCVIFGVDDQGNRSAWDPSGIEALDPAQIGDKLRKYVEGMDNLVSVAKVCRRGQDLPVMVVLPVDIPRVFANQGTYQRPDNQQQTHAFPKGGLYFRHGAKSEPAGQADLREAMERAIDLVREKWLGSIRQVMEAPPGARVQIVTTEVRASTDQGAQPIRIVRDSEAAPYRVVNPDETHPYRQKEIVNEVNARLVGKTINRFDVLCLARSLSAEQSRPDFFHEPKYGSKQYSKAFVDFVVDGCQSDPEFLTKARNAKRQTSARIPGDLP